MDCPKCGLTLKLTRHKGIEVDKCTGCNGMWLDFPELDQLEDTVLDIDEQKGSMITRPGESDIRCPQCQGPMQRFRYRYNELWLDVCAEEHGFWLDEDEEKRVAELMEQRTKDLRRSSGAEQDWDRLLGRVRSKSFLHKIKETFLGR
jgi:Zn-finger nucleic acid-binding protein